MERHRTTKPSLDVGLLFALYVLELSTAALLLALYKYVDRLSTLSGRQALLLLGPLVVLAATSAFLYRRYREFKRSGNRMFPLTLAMNLITVVIFLTVGEAVVRVFSVDSPFGPTFAGTQLVPRSWKHTTVRGAQLMKETPMETAFLVRDTLLGWTIGPNRRSKDGMYLSSAESLRSARADEVFSADTTSMRVAIVGDSYTFGEEGPFEDSWGPKLESLLAGDVKVLNFGVPGYGLDQAYLRYMRDVRPWRPSVAVLGFIQHDFNRSMIVYPVLAFPKWGFPLAKPRFGARDGGFTLLNAPLVGPESVLSAKSVAELPFVEYDPGYDAAEWRPRFYHLSHLVRFVLGRFPRYPLQSLADDDALLQLNTWLLLDFIRVTAAEGSVPIVAYYPSQGDFRGDDLSTKNAVLARLEQAGVPYLDLTECVRKVGPDRLFIPARGHYTAAANQAVAECLLPAVKHALAGQMRKGHNFETPATLETSR